MLVGVPLSSIVPTRQHGPVGRWYKSTPSTPVKYAQDVARSSRRHYRIAGIPASAGSNSTGIPTPRKSSWILDINTFGAGRSPRGQLRRSSRLLAGVRSLDWLLTHM